MRQASLFQADPLPQAVALFDVDEVREQQVMRIALRIKELSPKVESYLLDVLPETPGWNEEQIQILRPLEGRLTGALLILQGVDTHILTLAFAKTCMKTHWVAEAEHMLKFRSQREKGAKRIYGYLDELAKRYVTC